MASGIPFDTPAFVAFGLMLLSIAVLLKLVRRALRPKFKSRPLLNGSEKRLFAILDRARPRTWRVMVQVSYGEILKCSGRRYFTINAKRADFVLCDADFEPMAIVEYQGRGHYGRSTKDRDRAKRSDRQKRVALAEAEIPLIEVPAEVDPERVARQVADVCEAGKRAERSLTRSVVTTRRD